VPQEIAAFIAALPKRMLTLANDHQYNS